MEIVTTLRLPAQSKHSGGCPLPGILILDFLDLRHVDLIRLAHHLIQVRVLGHQLLEFLVGYLVDVAQVVRPIQTVR